MKITKNTEYYSGRVDSVLDAPIYYDEDGITIYNADCLDILLRLGTKRIDLILTDPPYGIGETNEKNATRRKLANTTNFGHYDWDKNKVDAICFTEMIRISLNQIIFGGNYYTEYLKNTSCWIVWDKDNGNNDFADCELAWTSFDTAVRKFRWKWNGMLQERMGKDKEIRTHPTQKPLALMEWCLKNYSKETDIILDPYMGSGTTLKAAKALGRKAIGIEINERYCEIAVRRLQQMELQLN